MNKMRKIAALFDVELNEEFNIMELGSLEHRGYKFTELGLMNTATDTLAPKLCHKLLNGDAEVVKLPWKPGNYEIYYYVSPGGDIGRVPFTSSSTFDMTLYAFGNCFPTREAAERNKAEIMKKYANIQTELNNKDGRK